MHVPVRVCVLLQSSTSKTETQDLCYHVRYLSNALEIPLLASAVYPDSVHGTACDMLGLCTMETHQLHFLTATASGRQKTF